MKSMEEIENKFFFYQNLPFQYTHCNQFNHYVKEFLVKRKEMSKPKRINEGEKLIRCEN